MKEIQLKQCLLESKNGNKVIMDCFIKYFYVAHTVVIFSVENPEVKQLECVNLLWTLTDKTVRHLQKQISRHSLAFVDYSRN